MTSDVEYFFMFLIGSGMSSFETCLLRYTVHFKLENYYYYAVELSEFLIYFGY